MQCALPSVVMRVLLNRVPSAAAVKKYRFLFYSERSNGEGVNCILEKIFFIRMYSSSIHYCHVVNRLRTYQLRGKVFENLGHEVTIVITTFLSVIGNHDDSIQEC